MLIYIPHNVKNVANLYLNIKENVPSPLSVQHKQKHAIMGLLQD